jgi:hypothetical protein
MMASLRHSFCFSNSVNYFQFWGDIAISGWAPGTNSSHTTSQAEPSSSFDADYGIVFEPDTPGIRRRAPGSSDHGGSIQPPNNKDQHILREAHIYDALGDTSFGHSGLGLGLGQVDGVGTEWNDFLIPTFRDAIPAEFDLSLGADAFGDDVINGMDLAAEVPNLGFGGIDNLKYAFIMSLITH